ncbi:MAG: hypothetical protein DSM106950_15595 [Stigonema ocellatum SAG 48.90 = DSM 106950]|nr:hypothetical protein [Stigonema ocellatum SAG 48.90 = DSM 106950]
MVQSGNGQSKNPQIEKVFEPLEDDTQQTKEYWVEHDLKTGRRELTSNEEVREELGIEESDDPESDE